MKGKIVLFLYITISLLLNIIVADLAYGYSTYGAPSEFGNSTDITCYVGGDEGIVNCTGAGYFPGGIFADVTGISNSTSYWDNLNTPADITGLVDSQISNDLTANASKLIEVSSLNYAILLYWQNITNRITHILNLTDNIIYSEKNTNSSSYWDNLDSPSDINTADLTDDNKFATTIGDIFSGNVDLDDNSGQSPKMRFLNELNNISEIYEQTDGDLYIKAADGFELVGNSFRMTTLTDCDTIDSNSNGVLSCGSDDDTTYTKLSEFSDDIGVSADYDACADIDQSCLNFISNCSASNSCPNIIYSGNTTWILTSSWANVTAGEWITPAYISDVDDEDIESDLNTYVDIAGDIMTGPLQTTSLNITDLVDCDTIDSNSNGVLSCGSDDDTTYTKLSEFSDDIGVSADYDACADIDQSCLNFVPDTTIGNCSISNSCNDIIYSGNTSWKVLNASYADDSALLNGQAGSHYLDDTTIGNCSVSNSCNDIIYSGNTSWVVASETDSAHDDCSEINNCVSSAWDADADISNDEIGEAKIAFSTACASGSHYYLNGNDLACEVDSAADGNAKTLCGDSTVLLGQDATTCWSIDSTTECAASSVCGGGHTHSDIYFTETECNTNFVSRNAWTDHDSYPATCAAATPFIGTIGDTSTCRGFVSDTSPQLGGYLDTNGQNIGSTADEIENIYITTNNKIYLGTGQEGEIYYDGTKMVIKVN